MTNETLTHRDVIATAAPPLPASPPHMQTPASALLTLQVAADRTSMSRHLILVLAARGEFPAPTKFSIGAGTANVWREADVHDWISRQATQVAA